MNWRTGIQRFMAVTRTHLLALLLFTLLLLSVARGYIIESFLPPPSQPDHTSISRIEPGW